VFVCIEGSWADVEEACSTDVQRCVNLCLQRVS